MERANKSSDGCHCAGFPLRIAGCVAEAQMTGRWTGTEWEEIVRSFPTLREKSRRWESSREEENIFLQCDRCETVWELAVSPYVLAMHVS